MHSVRALGNTFAVMKKLFTSVLLSLTMVVTPLVVTGFSGGCTRSQQRKTVNTIATLGYTVDASYKAYLDLVVTDKLPTNSVPAVSKSYTAFQSAYNTALTLSVMNSNAPPSLELNKAAADVTAAIKSAKGQ